MRGNKNWTIEDISYLEGNWGRVSIPTIAAHLERTINAVKLKANRIGLSRHIHSGSLITLNQFCEAIGKKTSYSWIKDRWVRLGLPVQYRKTIKKKYAMIDIEDFWKWAEHHKDVVDFSFEENILGKEPSWVKEARRASYLAKMNTKPWTLADDNKLKYMLNQYRYTYDDVCRELNRSEGAIKRRMVTLGLKQRPIRHYAKHWQDDETEMLLSMKEAGHCFEEIGRRLKRSGSAVRGKYERLQHPEYSKRWYRKMRAEGKIA